MLGGKAGDDVPFIWRYKGPAGMKEYTAELVLCERVGRRRTLRAMRRAPRMAVARRLLALAWQLRGGYTWWLRGASAARWLSLGTSAVVVAL